MGSGWAALVWEPTGKRLLITQIYDHQSNLAQAGVPLMVVDAWEHAYYLQYRIAKSSSLMCCGNCGIGETSLRVTPPHSNLTST
jgi:Fe-Mn family superoxide dismutase